MYENDSLIEIAIELMQTKKRKAHTIASIAKDVFEIKGLKMSECKELFTQFQIDFMLCGKFICCGEDSKGSKLWDLKERLPHDMQDKEGVYMDDPYNDDEDVIKNELKDDIFLNPTEAEFDVQFSEDEEDDDEDEKDDIEEELIMNDMYEGDKSKKPKIIEEDDDKDDDFDDPE